MKLLPLSREISRYSPGTVLEEYVQKELLDRAHKLFNPCTSHYEGTQEDILPLINRYTRLRRSGNTYRGRCPIHGGQNKNSLSVDPEKGVFHCFSCGAGGGVNKFKELMNES